jgi:hypothetical protein
MKTATLFTTVSLVLLMGFVLAPRVLADGEYGQAGGGQPSEQPKEAVHTTVQAGVGDNLLVAGAIAGVMGGMLFLMAKATRRAYFLD